MTLNIWTLFRETNRRKLETTSNITTWHRINMEHMKTEQTSNYNWILTLNTMKST